MTPDQYVASVLSRYTGPKFGSPVIAAANAIIPSLNGWAGGYLASRISFSGSFAKGTTVLGGTDIDLFISLKPSAPVLGEIYQSLLSLSQNQGWFPRAQN